MLRYGPCVTRGSHSFTCYPHTYHTCLYSLAVRHHHPLAGTHCAYPNVPQNELLPSFVRHLCFSINLTLCSAVLYQHLCCLYHWHFKVSFQHLDNSSGCILVVIIIFIPLMFQEFPEVCQLMEVNPISSFALLGPWCLLTGQAACFTCRGHTAHLLLWWATDCLTRLTV